MAECTAVRSNMNSASRRITPDSLLSQFGTYDCTSDRGAFDQYIGCCGLEIE
jgi:hypothetical protein